MQERDIPREAKYLSALIGLEFVVGAVMGAIGLLAGNTNTDLGAAALIGSSAFKSFLMRGNNIEFYGRSLATMRNKIVKLV